MEPLQYCARNSFNDPFVVFEEEPHSRLRPGSALSAPDEPPDSPFETLEIRHGSVGDKDPGSPQKPAFYGRSRRSALELNGFFTDQAVSEIVPQLRLVCITSRLISEANGTAGCINLNVKRSTFEHLIETSRASPWILSLISSKYDGFHYMKAQGQYADTYFLGLYHGAIAWTFIPATACTNVMLFTRLQPNQDDFYALLGGYVPHLFTPYVPLMAMTLRTMLAYDESLDGYMTDISQVEKGTGFSWVGKTRPDIRFNVDTLAEWSRKSAFVQINVINLLRHHANCVHALHAIEELHAQGDLPGLRNKPGYDKAMEEILCSIQILKMRANSFVSYANYIKSRTEAQISVIFSLLSHEDSVSNLKLAEASMAIAAAAKRDSSAMKTIAVMTMVFLPATFLAAFFALPIFEWQHKRGVQMDGLELYWAVALPSTIVVFLVWLLVTQIQWSSRSVFRNGGEADSEKQKIS